MGKRIMKLPNGENTTNRMQYFEAWRELVKSVEEAFGWECVSFDPGATFSVAEEDGSIGTAKLSPKAFRDVATAAKSVRKPLVPAFAREAE